MEEWLRAVAAIVMPEERILAAFALHAEALLQDLGREREDFWGSQVAVVDALLKEASDKVAQAGRGQDRGGGSVA